MLCGVQDLLLIYEVAMVEVGRMSLQDKSLFGFHTVSQVL